MIGFDTTRFLPTNALSFDPPWNEDVVDWWRSHLFEPHGLYPDELGHLLSASAREPKVFEFSRLDREAGSFVIRVKGMPSESGEVWFHQRNLDLRGRIFEAQRMVIPFGSQGKGKGRLLMADLVETAARLGIRKIEVEAQDIGRYACARFGFVPDRGSWRFQIQIEARRRLNQARGQMPPARFAFCREVLESEDANAIRVAAAWDDPVDSTREFDANGYPVKIPLGKALLLETSAQWFGTFDLDDAETMAIYRHYAGKPSS